MPTKIETVNHALQGEGKGGSVGWSANFASGVGAVSAASLDCGSISFPPTVEFAPEWPVFYLLGAEFFYMG